MRARRERKDATHGTLVARFVAQGCSFLTLPAILGGVPDGIAGCARRNHFIEFKNLETSYGRAGASPVQLEWAAAWRGERPFVVATVADVDALVKFWRQGGAE